MPIQRWTVGRATVTSIVEDETPGIPPELFFPEAKAQDVKRHPHLVPDFADAQGRLTLRVQAFVVAIAGRHVLVDPCVGNGKKRAVPFWNERSWPFLERFAGGLRLEPTPGHTPGHVSLWIESEGEVAVVTGDFLHHPVQCAELSWAEVGDEDPDTARATRRRMLARAAEKRAIVFGTHFATRPAGRVERVGESFRFVPL
jgi:glyoxylase-like metal-dependent hydrolase (beta-lactamase superfamily II)